MAKESTRKPAAKKRIDHRKEIKSRYIEFVLTGDDRLATVFSFCKALQISEMTFYRYFNSFRSLEQNIWKDWINQTLEGIKSDSTFETFSVREKLLSFFYAWFEMAKSNRSFVHHSLKNLSKPTDQISALVLLRRGFLDFIRDLLEEGNATGEVPERKPFSVTYAQALWFQFMFLQHFWLNDNSDDFSRTDAAIEKSVNLTMDLIGRGPVDSIFDFGKFMFQNSTT